MEQACRYCELWFDEVAFERNTGYGQKITKADIDRVADIWLDTNLKAHDFISAQYWKRNFKLVKEMLLQAEVYVYESDQKIQGFIGLNNDYIEGIFVSDKMQSQGIGKILLNDTKDKRNELRLNVYRKIHGQSLFTRGKVLRSRAMDWMKLLEKKIM